MPLELCKINESDPCQRDECSQLRRFHFPLNWTLYTRAHVLPIQPLAAESVTSANITTRQFITGEADGNSRTFSSPRVD